MDKAKRNAYVKSRYKPKPARTVSCQKCGAETTASSGPTKYCAKCSGVAMRANIYNSRKRIELKKSGQYSIEEQRICECGEMFLAFSAQEKLCHECKRIHKLNSKLQHRLGATFHEYEEKAERHTVDEILEKSNYRIDNDPNNLFTGAYFRMLDIRGGVADGWLVGAKITHLTTKETKLAEEWVR